LKMNKNVVGLSVGLLMALIHALWAITVISGLAGTLLNWILPLHSLSIVYELIEFSFVNALILIVVAFIAGYVIGWLYAWIHDWVQKKVK